MTRSPNSEASIRRLALGVLLRRAGQAIFVLAAAVAATAVAASPDLRVELVRTWFLLIAGDTAGLRDFIRSRGLWGPFVSVALMVVQALAAPVPGFLITYANGLVYGLVWGWLLSLVGHLIAALVAFAIARALGRRALSALVSETWLNEIDHWFARYGIYAVLVARLVPGVSFDAVSYAAGLTSMNWAMFAGVTLLGSVPQTFVIAYLGDRLPQSLVLLLILSGVLVLAIAAAALIFHQARHA